MFRLIKGFLAGLAAGVFAVAAVGHESKANPAVPANAAAASVEAKGTRDPLAYFTDTVLLTQDGKPVRFFSDVLAGHTVLLNVIYTSCEDACPLITQQLIFVAERLDGRLGKDIRFVSVSSDPEVDSPVRLKEFAKKNNSDRDGWIYLTGKKPEVDAILKRLGQLSNSREEHSTLVLGINVADNRFNRFLPNAPVAAIAERIKLLADGPAVGR